MRVRKALIFHPCLMKTSTASTAVWDPQGLPTGLYVLKVKARGKTHSAKFLVQN